MKGQGVHFFPIDEFDQFYIRWPSWLKLLAKRYISLQLKILIHFKFDDRARHLKPSRYVATLSSLNILLPELMLLPKVLRYVTPMGMLLHGSICYHATMKLSEIFFLPGFMLLPNNFRYVITWTSPMGMLLYGAIRYLATGALWWAWCYLELSKGHVATWSSLMSCYLNLWYFATWINVAT